MLPSAHLPIQLLLLLRLVICSPHSRPALVAFADLTLINLHSTQNTTAYRRQPLPQLNCVSGACENAVNQVTCTKASQQAPWDCRTKDLAPPYKLAVEELDCEWSDQTQKFIIAGSCSLRYRIEMVRMRSADQVQERMGHFEEHDIGRGDGMFVIGMIFIFGMFGIFILIVCVSICIRICTGNVGLGGRYYPYTPYYGDCGSDGFGSGAMLGYMMGRGSSCRTGYYGGGGFSSSHCSSGFSSSGGHITTGFGGTTRR